MNKLLRTNTTIEKFNHSVKSIFISLGLYEPTPDQIVLICKTKTYEHRYIYVIHDVTSDKEASNNE